MKPVGLITDFGTADHYAGVMKSVIKTTAPGVDVIDITHGVKPFSIVNAQFMLDVSYPYISPDGVVAVVVDPGVGSGRAILIARDGGRVLVMPDNGIISAVIDRIEEVYEADTTEYTHVSTNFHGRDIFAPLVAKLASGARCAELGQPVTTFKTRPYPGYTVSSNGIAGQILHIDHFGNCVTSIPVDTFFKSSAQLFTVAKKGLALPTVTCATYTDLSNGSAGLLPGSSGYIELSMNQQSPASLYSIDIEDEVVIRYE